MKQFTILIGLAFLLSAVTAPAQTILINASALEVIGASSATRAFYNLDDVMITERLSTGGVEIFEAATRTTIFTGDTSDITLTGVTLWGNKKNRLRAYFQEVTTTTGYRSFIPRRGVGYRYRTSTGVLTAFSNETKQVLWYGAIDSLKISGVTTATNILAHLRTKQFLENLRSALGIAVAPTITAGAGAGTSPTIAIAGTPLSGKITLTTGTSAGTSGVICTVTLPFAMPTGAFVQITQADPDAAAHVARWSVDETSTSTFTLNVGATALSDATQYKWNYQVTGY